MTDTTVDPRCLVGVAEVAHLLGVGRTTVSAWYDRRERTLFPEIVARLASGPIWDVDQVVSWYVAYVPKKGQRPGVMPARRGKSWAPASASGVQGP
jgi:hypothetical protein